MRWNVLCVETEKKEDWISRKAMVLSTAGRSVPAVCAATGQTRRNTNRENNIFFMPYFIDLLLFNCYTLISSFLIRYHLFFFRTKIHFIVGLNGDLYLFHILG